MNGEFVNDWYAGIVMVRIKMAKSISTFINRRPQESWFVNMDHEKYS